MNALGGRASPARSPAPGTFIGPMGMSEGVRLPPCQIGDRALRFGLRPHGFTLVGVLISLSLTVIVLGAIISAHLFGMKMFQLAGTRLGASRDNSRCFTQLTIDVRAAKMLKIGQGDFGSFTEVGANSAQQGVALQLYPSSSTNVYIRYYFDATDNTLKRLDTNSTLTTITGLVSNSNVFTLQDNTGLTLSNRQDHSIVSVRLNFSSFASGGDVIGGVGHYTSYGVQTKIATRAVE